MRTTLRILAGIAAILLAGCGPQPNDALSIAEELAANIDGATVLEVTPDSDPQGVYVGKNPPETMAVIYLPGSTCSVPNAPCGASVTVYPGDPDRVRKVAAYAQAMAVDNGTGYTYQVRDRAELIIDGKQDETTVAQLVADFDGDSPLAK